MIHEHGITLTETERHRLQQGEMTMDRQIAILFRDRAGKGYTFKDVVDATGFNQDSVKRSISNMAGSAGSEKYQDDYGRYPLVKTDEKRKNPDTGVNIHVYKWNHRYKQHPNNEELKKRFSGVQQNFHNL